jgi:aminoglycoside 6'-N-acetyltransferase I
MLNLNKVAEEFEMISYETHLYFNKKTGEFEYHSDFMDSDTVDAEMFEEDFRIAAPTPNDIDEYNIMVRFTKTVTEPRINELLCVALEGRGAFRRFKDTLHRVGLVDEWLAFKRDAYIDIARDWCEENGITYLDKTHSIKPAQAFEDKCSLSIMIIPLTEKAADDAAEVLVDALGYSKMDAGIEIRNMLKQPRIVFAALASDRVVGIIGAIPQYGITGWELHPLAVLKKYQRCGIGSALLKVMECEVIRRGGVMIYLGSDDESGATSLFGVNLYEDTFRKIENIKNIGGHPFPFYQKHGYKIVGVFPDANGIGKPDIWMSKRIDKA